MTLKAVPGQRNGLSPEMRDWAATVRRDYELSAHHKHLLELAAASYDRAQQARVVLDQQGPTFVDRFGQPRLRPEAVVERDAQRTFAQLVRQLGFEDAAPKVEAPPLAA